LANLSDNSPPLDVAVVIRGIEAELGKPIQELFATFDKNLTSSNWLGQTHRAAITDDDPVIVTVRRPELTASVTSDLAVLGRILTLVEVIWVDGKHQLASQFPGLRDRLLRMLPLITDARNTDRLAAQASDNPREYVPQVYWSHTTANVLTVEQLDGTSLADITDALDQAAAPVAFNAGSPSTGIDLQKVARNVLFNHLRQVLNGRYVHCRPTPDILTVLDDNVIGYRDCRAVQRIDSRFAERQFEVISAARARDVDALFQILWEYVEAPIDAPVAEFEASFQERASEWLEMADDPRAMPADRDVRFFFAGLLDDFRRFQIPAPVALLAYYHAFAATIASFQKIAPDLDIHAEMSVVFQEMLTERIEKKIDAHTISQTVLEYEQFVVTLPHQLRHFLHSARKERSPIVRSVNSWELGAWSVLHLLATLSIIGTVFLAAWLYSKPGGGLGPISWEAALALILGLFVVRRLSRVGHNRCAIGRRRMRWP
jgi:ubiquinone biosynthesis protein